MGNGTYNFNGQKKPNLLLKRKMWQGRYVNRLEIDCVKLRLNQAQSWGSPWLDSGDTKCFVIYPSISSKLSKKKQKDFEEDSSPLDCGKLSEWKKCIQLKG